jgi:hypothetical protein
MNIFFHFSAHEINLKFMVAKYLKSKKNYSSSNLICTFSGPLYRVDNIALSQELKKIKKNNISQKI